MSITKTLFFLSVYAIISTILTESVYMAKNTNKVKRSVKSGFDFSKLYFSKPTSVVLVTVYATILVLVLATFGFSKIITKSNQDTPIPSLPESEAFAFLPTDDIEIPALGDTTPEKETEKSDSEKDPSEPTTDAPSIPIQSTSPVVIEKEVKKEIAVTKTVEVPKEVVKTVEVPKEIVKEVVKEIPTSPDQNYFENYTAPGNIPYTEKTYKNYPDENETYTQETSTEQEDPIEPEPVEPEESTELENTSEEPISSEVNSEEE